mgnify:CR=1 FL=1|jgi:biotin-dependent carboxylase-like uncharacterized protein
MGIVVKKPGVATTVQDRGRVGYMGSGFSPSGVMDRRAFLIANTLVENDLDACVLEYALVGPTVRFTMPTFIALTGGDFAPKLDGKEIPLYTAIPVKRGSVLSMGSSRCGVYGYLAIAGGSLNVKPIMGSRSTNLKCELGGWKGRTLEAGDYIPFQTKGVEFMSNLGSHRIPNDPIYPPPGHEVTLRVVPGPQYDMFSIEGKHTFFNDRFTTTVKCDRMGYRLDGPQIQTVHGSDIISDGIAFGAVQVPAHGRPIIMLADRQTTGGYAKIGTIVSVDIPKLVQSRPGTSIRFAPVTVHEAQTSYRDEATYLHNLAKSVRRPCADGISPRRTARRLMPILEQQAKESQHESLWINSSEKERA